MSSVAVLFVRKRQTWLCVTPGIAAYVLVVGASASVVRAGMVGGLYVLVYRTDEHGTVTFTNGGERWWVEAGRQ